MLQNSMEMNGNKMNFYEAKTMENTLRGVWPNKISNPDSEYVDNQAKVVSAVGILPPMSR